jgi:hypothetical protein
MTARKTRKALTAEADKFTGGAFQPPQARSGMMKVAGASDDDPDRQGQQLITDDDPTTMKGPVTDDGRDERIMVTVKELKEMVRRLVRGP